VKDRPVDLGRRRFLTQSLASSGAGLVAGMGMEQAASAAGEGARGPIAAKSDVPRGRIGKLQISRLICGGNLFVGSAHSRELIYVAALMKQYFTPEKIMDTLQVCEENGINTAIMSCNDLIIGVLERYRKERGGKIQWLAQTYPTAEKPIENVQRAIDHGAAGVFIQGGFADRLVSQGHIDVVGKVIALVKQNGLVAGVGSHSLETPRSVEQNRLEPDFYFKTFNAVGYQSQKPEEIADFMKTVEKPWIAFKVLGAGVVRPADGFRLALGMGADFLAVGMFDFQVRDDALLIQQILAGDLNRRRPWKS